MSGFSWKRGVRRHGSYVRTEPEADPVMRCSERRVRFGSDRRRIRVQAPRVQFGPPGTFMVAGRRPCGSIAAVRFYSGLFP